MDLYIICIMYITEWDYSKSTASGANNSMVISYILKVKRSVDFALKPNKNLWKKGITLDANFVCQKCVNYQNP